MPQDRAARYARVSKNLKGPHEAVITAHVRRTPKGKIRLLRVGLSIGSEKEVKVNPDELPENDPRYVSENNYGVRKIAHDLVKKSGRYSRFYDTIVRVVYDNDTRVPSKPKLQTRQDAD